MRCPSDLSQGGGLVGSRTVTRDGSGPHTTRLLSLPGVSGRTKGVQVTRVSTRGEYLPWRTVGPGTVWYDGPQTRRSPDSADPTRGEKVGPEGPRPRGRSRCVGGGTFCVRSYGGGTSERDACVYVIGTSNTAGCPDTRVLGTVRRPP